MQLRTYMRKNSFKNDNNVENTASLTKEWGPGGFSYISFLLKWVQ